MKKTIIYLCMATFIFSVQSCDDGLPPPTPECEWNGTQRLTFRYLALKHPSTINSYHRNHLGPDRTEFFLDALLRTNGDGNFSKNIANITVKLVSSGQRCTGMGGDTYYKGDPNITGNTITMPKPTNSNFYGDVTVTIQSDTYINTTGSGAFYRIHWIEPGNEPGNFNGTIEGIKTTFINANGLNSIIVGRGENAVLIKNGERFNL